MRRSAPLAASGALLACLALASLARPRGDPPVVRRDPPAEPAGSEQRERLLASEPIDLNLATVGDLELLPGIGPTLGARIVEEREGGGRFRSVDELTRVRGIGPRTLERLRPLVSVAP